MPLEIERKFLVKDESFKALSHNATRIAQGYMQTQPGITVRFRIRGEKGYITIKGPSDEGGLARYEWEKEISLKDAEDLLKLCCGGMIEKTRYLVDFDGHTFEVDEFHGDNEGLVMAEVEMSSVDEDVTLPEWIGEEVTGDKRYYNKYMSVHPFKTWV